MRSNKQKELEGYIEELKTMKKEILDVNQSDKFLQSISYKFTLNNGITIPRERITKGGKDGSAVIIMPQVKTTKEILVTIEPRVFTKLGVSVGFPAGYIEAHESPIEAGIRELKEETGYTASSIKLIDSFYQDEGISSAYNHILFAKDCVKTSLQELDPYEVIRYMTFTYEELLELENMGLINSSNTKLTMLKTHKFIGGNNEI